jgi:predicted alpha/beta superfamily hydrolase
MSFIGHSLGGVIIRASLRYLQLYKNSFHCYVSIASPHMGYLYHTSTIVTTSMWVMNQVKKDQSMIELALSDNKTLTVIIIFILRNVICMNYQSVLS